MTKPPDAPSPATPATTNESPPLDPIEDTLAFLHLMVRATSAGYWALHVDAKPGLDSEARHLLCRARDAAIENERIWLARASSQPWPPPSPARYEVTGELRGPRREDAVPDAQYPYSACGVAFAVDGDTLRIAPAAAPSRGPPAPDDAFARDVLALGAAVSAMRTAAHFLGTYPPGEAAGRTLSQEADTLSRVLARMRARAEASRAPAPREDPLDALLDAFRGAAQTWQLTDCALDDERDHRTYHLRAALSREKERADLAERLLAHMETCAVCAAGWWEENGCDSGRAAFVLLRGEDTK